MAAVVLSWLAKDRATTREPAMDAGKCQPHSLNREVGRNVRCQAEAGGPRLRGSIDARSEADQSGRCQTCCPTGRSSRPSSAAASTTIPMAASDLQTGQSTPAGGNSSLAGSEALPGAVAILASAGMPPRHNDDCIATASEASADDSQAARMAPCHGKTVAYTRHAINAAMADARRNASTSSICDQQLTHRIVALTSRYPVALGLGRDCGRPCSRQ